MKAGLGRNIPCMPSIAKNDPWWLADPHRATYTKQGLLGPTPPNFWVYNPAYASVENTHVWPTAWADVINGGMTPEIGIGGHLAMPPLPHHRAYGSVPRRFDWVKLGRRRGVGEDRVSRSSDCAGPVGPPGVQTCARTPSANRRRPLHGTLVRHAGAVR
jgi:hypothetical protein